MYAKYLKRWIDFVGALFLIFMTLPLMIIASIAIKVEDSKGAIIFTQDRIGKDTKQFKVYKFRTMISNTHDNDGNELLDGERITRLGRFLRKTSIDELPQLFNIIKGDMSFIGPRPLLVRYLPYYTQEEIKRHNVVPGISGLAQITGRNCLSWRKRFEKDLEYVNNISFRLDIKIIIKTILKVIKRDDIVVSNECTMLDLDKERSVLQNDI